MTSYSREAAVFSQSHFSSKEPNSTERCAKKCKCRVGVNTRVCIISFLKIGDDGVSLAPGGLRF